MSIIARSSSMMTALDSASCHQCKSRRYLTDLHYCSNMPSPKRQCRKKFCNYCLEKFYEDAMPSGSGPWTCPGCRGICTCAACVRRADPNAAPAVSRHAASASAALMDASDISVLNIVPPPPEDGSGAQHDGGAGGAENAAWVDSQAKTLLWAITRDERVRRRMMQYISADTLSDQQKVVALTTLLNQAAFPDPAALQLQRSLFAAHANPSATL